VLLLALLCILPGTLRDLLLTALCLGQLPPALATCSLLLQASCWGLLLLLQASCWGLLLLLQASCWGLLLLLQASRWGLLLLLLLLCCTAWQ
jgi:hypothetical protein